MSGTFGIEPGWVAAGTWGPERPQATQSTPTGCENTNRNRTVAFGFSLLFAPCRGAFSSLGSLWTPGARGNPQPSPPPTPHAAPLPPRTQPPRRPRPPRGPARRGGPRRRLPLLQRRSSPPRSRRSTTRGPRPRCASPTGRTTSPRPSGSPSATTSPPSRGPARSSAPVLAVQYGYLPGLVWLVVGVCLGGAVQDMLVLAASVRRDGRSLAAIARAELGPVPQVVVSLAILVIMVIALRRAGPRRRQGARRRGGQAAAGHGRAPPRRRAAADT